MSVEIRNLIKRFGSRFELSIPSLSIASGETFGLVGNNGAGKTTFLRLLLNLLRADTGSVLIGQKNVAVYDEWKQSTGSYLDESFLLDFLTADEYIDFVGSVYGLQRAAIAEALDPFRPFFTDRVLGEHTKLLRDLSRGNAKKVGIVAAMLIKPRLLILDEPFANLDPGSQIQLKIMLAQLSMTAGATLIISSHDLRHITDVCQRIAILDAGSVVQDIQTSETTLHELELFFAARMG